MDIYSAIDVIKQYEELLECLRNEEDSAVSARQGEDACKKKFSALSDRIRAFCGTDAFNSLLMKICAAYPRITLTGGTLYYMGKLPRPLSFNENNCFELVEKWENEMKQAVTALSKKPADPDPFLRTLCLNFLSLKTVFFEKANLENKALAALPPVENEIAKQISEDIADMEAAYGELLTKKNGYYCSDGLEIPQSGTFSFASLKESDGEGEYSFGIPFAALKKEASDSNAQLARKYFGISLPQGTEILSLRFPDGRNALFVEEGVGFEKKNSLKFRTYIHRLVYSTILSFPVNTVEFAFVESKDVHFPVLCSVKELFRDAMEPYMFDNVANDKSSALKLLGEIDSECTMRQAVIFNCRNANGIQCENINDYNACNPNNPLRFILLAVHGYPNIFEDRECHEMLKRIIDKGGASGVFTMVIGNNLPVGATFGSPGETLDLERLDMEQMILNENGTACYNGREFSLTDAFFPDFDSSEKSDLDYFTQRQAKADKFFLDTIIEDSADIPFYEKISIPLGDVAGKRYYLETSTESGAPVPFTMIMGKTKSGKSAFLHAILMSAAMKYSPEEVEFHLLDFKTETDSAEFLCYKHIPGKENLYIPHIKYMSLKSKPENALEVINYIKHLISEKSKLGKFAEYNSRPEVRGDKTRRSFMPMTFVIIDEYKWMLEGGSGSKSGEEAAAIRSQVRKGLQYILMTARAFGIGVIFSGQTMELGDDSFNQIGNRLSFYNGPGVFSQLFNEWRPNMLSRFPKGESLKGYAYCAGSFTDTPEFVRMAYSGSLTGDRMKRLARTIREKYKDSDTSQIVVGDRGSAPLGSGYKTWEETIADTVAMAKMEYLNRDNGLHDFELSGLEEGYRMMRPLSIGISAMTMLPVELSYSSATDTHNYFAFACENVLNRVEQNTALAFIYQTAKNRDAKVIFCDTEDGYFDDGLGAELARHPFIKDKIEHIYGQRNIALKLIELAKQAKNGNSTPTLVIMHEVAWLNADDKAEWLKAPAAEAAAQQEKSQPAAAEADGNQSKAFVDGMEMIASIKRRFTAEQLAAKGLTDEKLMQMYNVNPSAAAAYKPVAPVSTAMSGSGEKLSIQAVKAAFAELYLHGNRKEIFLLATSQNYLTVINDVVLATEKQKDERKDLLNYAIYANPTEMSTHIAKNASANICYVLPHSTETRLYDYTSDEANAWWNELRQKMN